MTATLRVACIQNCATDDMEANLAACLALARAACDEGAKFILLPEHFAALQPSEKLYFERAFAEADHPALAAFRALARERDAWCLLGSLAVRGAAPGMIRNRSLLLDPEGGIRGRYDKIHLFDVRLRSGENYRESATVEPGEAAVTADTPWGRVGLTVCYDLRFAYLYRQLAHAGARFLTIPAAFTRQTGAAHWHTLVRARAIETGCYVFAPAQCGVRPWGRATYGHSLVVDPWGEVLADGGEAPGFVLADVDPARVDEARAMIPALEHDRACELRRDS